MSRLAAVEFTAAELAEAENELFGGGETTFADEPDYAAGGLSLKQMMDPRMKDPNFAASGHVHLPAQVNKIDAMVHVLAQRMERLERALSQVVAQKGVMIR